MPHFVIHCTENVLSLKTATELLSEVHQTAEATGLFAKGDIKVRIWPFNHSIVANEEGDFIHVFGNIMQGRSTEQKANLSREIVSKLTDMLPQVPVISMNVQDFEKSTYCNRTMI